MRRKNAPAFGVLYQRPRHLIPWPHAMEIFSLLNISNEMWLQKKRKKKRTTNVVSPMCEINWALIIIWDVVIVTIIALFSCSGFALLILIRWNKWIFYSIAVVPPLCGLVSNFSWLRNQIRNYGTCVYVCSVCCVYATTMPDIIWRKKQSTEAKWWKCRWSRIGALVFSSH